MLGCELHIFLFFILHFYILYYRCLICSMWVKKIIEYRWNNESTLKLLCFLNESWNHDHIFWLLRIIQNLGNKEIIIVIRKCPNIVYRGITMSKIKDCIRCKYYWKYNLYCLLVDKEQFRVESLPTIVV